MSLDHFERTMVARAREDAEGPDPSKKAAARRAMFEAAGVAATVTTVATSAKAAKAASTKAATSTLAPTLVKAGVLVTVIAGGAAGVHVATRSASTPEAASPPHTATASPTARPALVTEPPPSAVPAAIPSDVATFAASELPSARVDAPRPSAKPVDSAGDDPLAAEAKLLARARDALASGDLDAAKTALREHDARFPRGALGNEAELLAIDLAVAGGDRAEARRRAGIVLARDPQSPWRARLQKLMQAE